jgi:two-component system OmpR family sensor kinase
MSRTITFDAPDSLPAAEANSDALTTVVDHLLDNAIKYSPGGEDIDVSVSADDNSLKVMVSDHGIGMDAEQADHCFDRFWQAESTDVRRFGGTGIGLYIVQSLIHTMGGSIDVASSPGNGTTFTVRLRRVDSIPQPRQPGRGETTSIREFMRQIGVAQIAATEVNRS